MKTKIKFFLQENKWYASHPEINHLPLPELEMVAGADMLCDVLAEGESEVSCYFSDEWMSGWDICLVKKEDEKEEVTLDGANYYTLVNINVVIEPCWLCSVTLLLFNNTYPSTIFLKVIK